MHEAANLRNKSVQTTLCSVSRISSTSGKKLQETRLPQTDRATHYYYSLLQFITLSQLGEIQSTAAQL